jgi:hypothetical protein
MVAADASRSPSLPAPRFEPESRNFWLDDIRFKVSDGGSSERTGEDGLVLVKPWALVEQELAAVSGERTSRELGVKEGGSAVLWSLVLPLERYVGVDIRPLDISFPKPVTEHPRWPVIHLYGNTSQDDRDALERIMAAEFDGPLDLVVDDASHQYELTRRTFEVCFPKLRTGGLYIVEDWDWAESDGPWTQPSHPWYGTPSLSNLITRLVLLAATRHDIVDTITVRRSFVAVKRGPALLGADFDIEQATHSQRRLRELV